jgi:hypothetical protein
LTYTIAICFFLSSFTSKKLSCPNYWCNTKYSKKWSGPGEEGYVCCCDYSHCLYMNWSIFIMLFLKFFIWSFFHNLMYLQVFNPDGTKSILDPILIQCKDKEEQCKEWAGWNTNECETNSVYMHSYCPRSCNVCHESHDEL